MPTTVDLTMGLILPKLLILPVPGGLNMAKDIDPVIVTNPGTYLYRVFRLVLIYFEDLEDHLKITFRL